MSLTKKLPYRFRKRCESIASEQRNRLGLKASEPLPATLLAQFLSATIFFPQNIPNAEIDKVSRLLKSDQWSAGVIREAPLWIVHNPRHAPARQQSNLMHEFAHICLKHKRVGFDSSSGLPMRCDLDEDEATFLGDACKSHAEDYSGLRNREWQNLKLPSTLSRVRTWLLSVAMLQT